MTNGTAVLYVVVGLSGVMASFVIFHIRQIDKTIDGLKSEMRAGRAELKADMNAGHAELKAEIKSVHTEMKAEIKSVRTEMKTEISGLAQRVRKLETNVAILASHISRLTPFIGLITQFASAGEPAPEQKPTLHTAASDPGDDPQP